MSILTVRSVYNILKPCPFRQVGPNEQRHLAARFGKACFRHRVGGKEIPIDDRFPAKTVACPEGLRDLIFGAHGLKALREAAASVS